MYMYMVEVQRGHSEQALCSCVVVLSLLRAQKQNLLNEKLLTGMENWFGNHRAGNMLHHARSD